MLRTPNIDSILVGFLTFITSVLVIGEHYFFILLAGLVYFGLIKSFVDCLPQAYGSQSNSWFWGSPKSSPNPVKKEVDVPKNSTLHFISKPFLDSLTQMWKKMTNADTPATNSNDPLSQKKTSATSNDSLSQNKAPANNNKALSQNGTPANNNKALSQNGTSQTARRGLRK
ncbi:hypothetical protein DI09_24p70 [Mitosporidium daphniae]|uniref:Uncharacterized protein n=1 Tax=Mitosporidium daphniae TaxID=1485682 RepID=A0A098VW10_9MICR|nr:uncharacterized protein DI09_24p70 [Mitosporidium daphniae]KGG51886.1 hypothetical protein DI09_24p70 [Mitosporidium daphniae]|eukprot:XP_013238347.1 uncharacterized protein DI09_24p70 [Mitosporidium daphniae]